MVTPIEKQLRLAQNRCERLRVHADSAERLIRILQQKLLAVTAGNDVRVIQKKYNTISEAFDRLSSDYNKLSDQYGLLQDNFHALLEHGTIHKE